MKLAQGHTSQEVRTARLGPQRPRGDLSSPARPQVAAHLRPPFLLRPRAPPTQSSVLDPLIFPLRHTQFYLQTSSQSHTHYPPQFFILCQKPVPLSSSPISPWDLPHTDQKAGGLLSSSFLQSQSHTPTDSLCPASLLSAPAA